MAPRTPVHVTHFDPEFLLPKEVLDEVAGPNLALLNKKKGCTVHVPVGEWAPHSRVLGYIRYFVAFQHAFVVDRNVFGLVQNCLWLVLSALYHHPNMHEEIRAHSTAEAFNAAVLAEVRRLQAEIVDTLSATPDVPTLSVHPVYAALSTRSLEVLLTDFWPTESLADPAVCRRLLHACPAYSHIAIEEMPLPSIKEITQH